MTHDQQIGTLGLGDHSRAGRMPGMSQRPPQRGIAGRGTVDPDHYPLAHLSLLVGRPPSKAMLL